MNLREHNYGNNKFSNPNESSMYSHQNYPPQSNIHPSEIQANEYLANLQKDEEPDFVKYYKRLVPGGNINGNSQHQIQQNQQRLNNSESTNRVNPFANK